MNYSVLLWILCDGGGLSQCSSGLLWAFCRRGELSRTAPGRVDFEQGEQPVLGVVLEQAGDQDRFGKLVEVG